MRGKATPWFRRSRYGFRGGKGCGCFVLGAGVRSGIASGHSRGRNTVDQRLVGSPLRRVVKGWCHWAHRPGLVCSPGSTLVTSLNSGDTFDHGHRFGDAHHPACTRDSLCGQDT